MKEVAYPSSNEIMVFEWTADFKYTDEYAAEMRVKFPEWADLHQAIAINDHGHVDALLSAYCKRLSVFSPQEVVDAAEANELEELVIRARKAVELKNFLAHVEERYFPERIQARKEEYERNLASWTM